MILFEKLIIVIPLLLMACNKDDPQDDACFLIPETGPCEALIPRYYYDQDEGKCKEFTWGGCEGVVPFKTMEACKSACGE
ncbi:MAG: proteinase inhibitor I4 serpin [Candidatus Marinimicrobia bacterium]|nr:proteinase inhibitor I4 serpin [Candidatus Neomarinimicrobiota bacterium]MBT3676350.1 proteinase inhibitor I4 serpin [Candidatus Neomarinimicrobiota bacterium]MBT3763076.1 proteinase inhibitor I4 serpin [Candidatus Neomarinimicrobiota bacterium]MBT4067100.1 proteinase inhibitor I4 serpin [Candidatus Neomarinimicrobiota bacterium]MBT4270459.1 proteinase inhibitor I4 serpin [Candidatus Neomarinimicrobiota bacterium]